MPLEFKPDWEETNEGSRLWWDHEYFGRCAPAVRAPRADVLKKVQAAGKNLHITIPAEEVEQALSRLSARGLFIQTPTRTEPDARDLLKQAGRRSVDHG